MKYFDVILKAIKLPIKKLKRKILKNKIDETKVDDKPNLIEKLIKDIYGEDYVGNNSIGKKVEILVDDIPMEIDNIQIIPQHFLNSTYFEIEILISFEQYSKIQEEWFKKECTFKKTKKPQFFNIKYPVLTDTKDCDNWQEYKFVLNNLIKPKMKKVYFIKYFLLIVKSKV